MKTIRLTMAQALVRYLVKQRIMNNGHEEALFPGVFRHLWTRECNLPWRSIGNCERPHAHLAWSE